MFRPRMPSLDLAQAALQSTAPSQGHKGPAPARAAAPDPEGECQAVQAFLESRQRVVGLPCLAADLLEHLLGAGQEVLLSQAAIVQLLELQQALPGVCPAAWCLGIAASGGFWAALQEHRCIYGEAGAEPLVHEEPFMHGQYISSCSQVVGNLRPVCGHYERPHYCLSQVLSAVAAEGFCDISALQELL